MPRWLGLVVFVSMLGIVGCGGGASESARVVVTGSSTVAPLVSEIARRFEAEHAGVRIDVQTGGSSRGLADVRNGLAEIGMVSRSPGAGEGDVLWHPIARDGLAMIVHAENPQGAITEAQVQAIYRGEIETWGELEAREPLRDGVAEPVAGTITETSTATIAGKSSEPITVVSKAEGRSTLEVFLGHFGLEAAEIEADVIIGDNQQGIKTVAGNPHAIAYVSIGTAEFEVSRGTPIRLLGLGDVAASTEAVRRGDYPIARTLHLVTVGEPEGWARTFLEYCRSPAVADLVAGQFFLAL